MALGIKIESNNFNGKSVEITFNPYSGGTIDLGTQTIPYDYISTNYEGEYSIYIPEYDKTCPLFVGNAPSPTPTPTSTITPTPTITSSPTPTPTPSSSPAPSFDADAAAYLADVIASGGTTDATISAATNTLFTELKSNGLYDKMFAMYPFVGATSSSHAINANLNKTYDITWYGGMTHDVSGSTGNATNSYGLTNFDTFTFDQDSIAMGFYQNSIGSDDNFRCMGTATNNRVALVTGSQYQGGYLFSNGDRGVNASKPHGGNILGNYINSRYEASGATLYRNAVEELSIVDTYTKSSAGFLSFPVFVLRGSDGTIFNSTHMDVRMGFIFLSDGLNPTEVSTLDNIINTFQTSLGRNVY